MDKIIIGTKQDVYNVINGGAIVSQQSWMIIVIALGGTFIDAYDFTSLGIGAVQLKQQFHLTSFQLGSMTAAMAFGALIASLIGGYYVDKIGRLKMFVLDLGFFVVSALGAAFAPNLIVLLIFRFFMGVGVGLDFPAALSFVAEYTSISKKGQAVNVWQFLWYIAATFGFVIIIPIYFLGAGPNLWRWAVGIGALPALLVLILRYFYMDESPMWAASRGNLPEAVDILKRVYGLNVELGEVTTESNRVLSASSQWKLLLSQRYRARTIMAGTVGMTQAMEYFAVGFYLPTVSQLIFGKQFLYALLGSVVFNVFGIIGGGLNVKFSQRLGIRRIAIVGYVIVLCTLVIIGILQSQLPVYISAILIALFIFGHSFGPGASGMTLGAISYPTEIRGVGAGLIQGLIRIGSILGFYFFPLVLSAAGLAHTLLILAIVPFIGLIVTSAIRWEPVGRDVDLDFEEVSGVGSHVTL